MMIFVHIPNGLAIKRILELLYILKKNSKFNNSIINVREYENGWRTMDFGDEHFMQSFVKIRTDLKVDKSPVPIPECVEFGLIRTMLTGFALLDLNCKKQKKSYNLLFIGLGAGALPNFVHKFFPEHNIEVLEISPEVVKVAKLFFGFKEEHNLRVRIGDAINYLKDTIPNGTFQTSTLFTTKTYDGIFMDAYDINFVPPKLTTQGFLKSVNANLEPQGIFVVNFYGTTISPLDTFVTECTKVFDTVYVIPVADEMNSIVFALKTANSEKEKIILSKWIERASEISKEKTIPFDLGETLKLNTKKMSESEMLSLAISNVQ